MQKPDEVRAELTSGEAPAGSALLVEELGLFTVVERSRWRGRRGPVLFLRRTPAAPLEQ